MRSRLLLLLAPLFALIFAGTVSAQPGIGLVPLNQVTHTAIRSGDWSDPTIWSPSAALPGIDARVHVPTGIALRYDLEQSPRLATVRVDGRLHFAVHTATHMLLDTLVVTPTGTLEVGTVDAPISARARVTFRHDGQINPAADPALVGRGMIVSGAFRSAAKRREAYVRLATDPRAGATVLQLAVAPVGWQIGDRIVICGTRHRGWQWNGAGNPRTYLGTDDEVRQVLAVDGTQVTVAALTYDHVAPATDLHSYVANLSRDIVFEGEGGATVPAQERPHVMFAGTLDVDAADAAFVHLGRTDKSVPIDDVGTNLDGSPGGGTNPRGRYSVHFHRGGADDVFSAPAVLRGCAVEGSPGWGIVSHDAHVVVEDCVSYDVLGSHYVTEEGQELGAFRRCIAIRSRGAGPDDGRFVKDNVNLHDFAHQGHGFWFQGRNVVTEDLVACGTTSAAFFWFHRSGVIGPQLTRQNLLLPFDYTRFRDALPYNDVPIAAARRLEAFASSRGFWVIKANGWQGHDLRSTLEDLTGWNVDHGMTLEYTRHYALRRLRFIGNDANNRWRTGLSFGSLVRDQVVEDLHVERFGNGVSFATFFAGQPDAPDVTFIDPAFVNVGVATYVDRDPVRQQVITAAQLVPGRFTFTPDPTLVFELPPTLAWNSGFRLTGTKLDSVGSWAVGEDGEFGGVELRRLVSQGYYTRPQDGSRFVPVVELMTDRLTGAVHEYAFELDIVTNYPFLGPNLGTWSPTTNALPTAANLTFTVPPDGRLVVSAPTVLDAANDPDGNTLQVLLPDVGQPADGLVSMRSDGSFVYTGRPGAVGSDSFVYRVTDRIGRSQLARITLDKPRAAGSFARFGQSCAPGTELRAMNGTRPAVGTTLEFGVDGISPSTTAAFTLFGFDRNNLPSGAPLPLPLDRIGAPGCDLLVAPAAVLPLLLQSSRAAGTLPIPNDPLIAGVQLYLQCAAIDPAANPLGLALTDAAIVTVGF